MTFTSGSVLLFLVFSLPSVFLIFISMNWNKNTKNIQWKFLPMGYLFLGLMLFGINLYIFLSNARLTYVVNNL